MFEDNGTGVRGDMKAVITAILLDPEARDPATATTQSAIWQGARVAGPLYPMGAGLHGSVAQRGYWLSSTEDPIYGLGEMTLRSPTVFNWFAPGYVPPATSIEAAGLVAPEMQMTNVTTVVGYLNYMQGAIGGNATSGPDVFASYDTELGSGGNADALLDRMNLLLMAGQMDSNAAKRDCECGECDRDSDQGDQNAINAALAARVQTAVYLTMASPDFTAQQ